MNNLDNKRDVFKGHCNIIRLTLCSSSDYAVKVPFIPRNPMNNDTPSPPHRVFLLQIFSL